MRSGIRGLGVRDGFVFFPNVLSGFRMWPGSFGVWGHPVLRGFCVFVRSMVDLQPSSAGGAGGVGSFREDCGQEATGPLSWTPLVCVGGTLVMIKRAMTTGAAHTKP